MEANYTSILEEDEHVYPPMADNVCDTPQEALGSSGGSDKYGYCFTCGYHSTCHDY